MPPKVLQLTFSEQSRFNRLLMLSLKKTSQESFGFTIGVAIYRSAVLKVLGFLNPTAAIYKSAVVSPRTLMAHGLPILTLWVWGIETRTQQSPVSLHLILCPMRNLRHFCDENYWKNSALGASNKRPEKPLPEKEIGRSSHFCFEPLSFHGAKLFC